MYIHLDHITKSYGALSVLDQVSLTLKQDICYCLMSPSGSGKTTLLRILMGLEQPDSGLITAECHEGSTPFHSLRISAVFQENRLCESFSPMENVAMVLGNCQKDIDLKKELLKLLPEECLTRPVSTLSGGMKRRVAILRAVLAPSDILLLDEPFTGLDEGTKQEVIRYILDRRAGRFLLVTTHQEEDALLLNGQIIRL